MLKTKKIRLLAPPTVNPVTGDMVAWAKLADVAATDFSDGPNLRSSTLGAIQRDLIQTLKRSPATWVRHNGGQVYTVRAASYDEKAMILNLTQREGVQGVNDDGKIDGGHTHSAVREYLFSLRSILEDGGASDAAKDIAKQELRALEQAAIKVEVIIGMDEKELPEVCEDRNTTKAQKEASILNHNGTFASLNKALGDIAADVKFFEGDRRADGKKKTIDVEDVVRMVTLMADGEPEMAYEGVTRMLQHFREQTETANPSYAKATQTVLTAISLFNQVEDAIADVMANTDKYSPMKKATFGVRVAPSRMTFSVNKVPAKIPLCFTLPVASAVLKNCFTPGAKNMWERDPDKIFKKVKTALIERVFTLFKEYKVGTTKFGKEHEVYTDLQELVADSV